VWIYDDIVEPRFAGAPAIVESKRSYEMPDFNFLLEGADIAVKLYGGAITLRLDGAQRRGRCQNGPRLSSLTVTVFTRSYPSKHLASAHAFGCGRF
jgi:hypothetical protein